MKRWWCRVFGHKMDGTHILLAPDMRVREKGEFCTRCNERGMWIQYNLEDDIYG